MSILACAVTIMAGLWLGFRIYRNRRAFGRYLRGILGALVILAGVACFGFSVILKNIELCILGCCLLYSGSLVLPD